MTHARASAAVLGAWLLAACGGSGQTSTTRTARSDGPAKTPPAAAADATPEASDTATSAERSEASTFAPGGAKVGDADTQSEVKQCHAAGHFFDRFGGAVGECTDLDLARVNCSIGPLRSSLSAKQRGQLDELLAGSFKGWILDQCLDCSADVESELCAAAKGVQIGTKLFFVKEENGDVRGKGMLVPGRSGAAGQAP